MAYLTADASQLRKWMLLRVVDIVKGVHEKLMALNEGLPDLRIALEVLLRLLGCKNAPQTKGSTTPQAGSRFLAATPQRLHVYF